MASDIGTVLAEARRGFVTAAAGCGKTEAIAMAVNAGDHGRQLILTHTHAGVRALRQRLEKYKTPKGRYHLDTLAGWALTYAVHYPQLSGLQDKEPSGESWRQVYTGAACALESSAVRRVVTESYAGLYVDEYQDCTAGQHRLVLKLADILPCRVLGDPLQGIFDFGTEPLIDWTSAVAANFDRLPELDHPWRWETVNPALGRRLKDIRAALLAGEEIDLQAPPVVWRPLTPKEEWQACLEAGRQDGSVVAIRKWASACHSLAAKLKGRFTSMEEMDSQDLRKWAGVIERSEGPARALRVIEFAAECMTVVGTELSAVRATLGAGAVPDIRRVKKHPGAVQALIDVAGSASLLAVLPALDAIGRIPQRVLYRRELWREMERTLQLQARTPGASLRDAAWKVRNRDAPSPDPARGARAGHGRAALGAGLSHRHRPMRGGVRHRAHSLPSVLRAVRGPQLRK